MPPPLPVLPTLAPAGPWSAEGRRTIEYVLPKGALHGEAKSTEEQAYFKAIPGHLYVVEALQQAPALPFGKAFRSKILTVLQRAGESRSTLTLSVQLEFLKSIMAKSMVKKAARQSIAETSERTLAVIEAAAREWGETASATSDAVPAAEPAPAPEVQTLVPPWGAMTAGQLAEVQVAAEESEDPAFLRPLFARLCSEVRDVVARIESVEGLTQHDVWAELLDPPALKAMVEQWREASIAALQCIDTISSRLDWLPPTPLAPPGNPRYEVASLVRSPPVRSFIVRSTSVHAHPQLLGLISAFLDEPILASMCAWEKNVRHAIASADADILADHVIRLREDVARQPYGAEWARDTTGRLVSELKELRVAAVLGALHRNSAADLQHAVAMLRVDGLAVDRGSTMALLMECSPDRFHEVALHFARLTVASVEDRLVSRAERLEGARDRSASMDSTRSDASNAHQPADRVAVTGLTSPAGKRLNGKRGEVVGFDSHTDRYRVKIEGEGYSLAPRNLERA